MSEDRTHENNRMLELASKIRLLTLGMCRVGPGPYGFGVCNTSPSNIGITVNMSPNPYGNQPIPSDIERFRVTVDGFDKKSQTVLGQDEVVHYANSGDAATRTVAAAILELSKTPVEINAQEFDDAFDIMARREMGDQDIGLTKQEALQLANICWHIGKTAEEIVAFQLYERRLCMPFEKYHEAVESVLDRPVLTHEFGIENWLQDEYRQKKFVQTAGAPMSQADFPDTAESMKADGGADEIEEGEAPQQTFQLW